MKTKKRRVENCIHKKINVLNNQKSYAVQNYFINKKNNKVSSDFKWKY